jgi:hypothetical protein
MDLSLTPNQADSELLRFVFGSGLTGIVRIDILEPKLLSIGDAVRRYKLLGSFDDFFSFHLLAES